VPQFVYYFIIADNFSFRKYVGVRHASILTPILLTQPQKDIRTLTKCSYWPESFSILYTWTARCKPI